MKPTFCPHCGGEINVNLADAPTLDRFRLAIEERDAMIAELSAILVELTSLQASQ